MLIAVIFFFLLEHNQQIIYFCSFITEPLLTEFLPFKDQKLGGSLLLWFVYIQVGCMHMFMPLAICYFLYQFVITSAVLGHKSCRKAPNVGLSNSAWGVNTVTGNTWEMLVLQPTKTQLASIV